MLPLRPAAPARRPRARGAAPARTRACVALHAGQRPQHRAQPADLDAQPRAMRFVGVLRAERARDERVPRHVARPRFGQRAREREQHRTRRERDHRAASTHDVAAGVDDERVRRQQRLDLLEQERALLAARDQARRGRVQHARSRFRLPPSAPGCRAWRAACSARASAARAAFVPAGAASRCPRRPARARPATRAGRARGRARRARARPRRAGRSGAGAGPRDAAHARRSPGRRALRASPAPRRAPSRASPGRARRARSRPRRRRSARGPRPLSDRRRAPRVAAAPSRAPRSPSCAIAMPRSASAGAIVAQRDPLQRAERIARRERARRGGDQRVHAESRHTCHSQPSVSGPNLSHDRHTSNPGTYRRPTMTNSQIVSREEWLQARLELLAAEKEFTRRDELARAAPRRCPGSAWKRPTCSRADERPSRSPICSTAAPS